MSIDTNSDVSLIGIPLDLGAENLGVDIGPEAFRYQQIVNKLKAAGLHVKDTGDIATHEKLKLKVGDPKMRYIDEIVRVSEESAKLSEGLLRKGNRIVAVGGDHSINLGVVSGASVALSGDIGLIYLDAHGDMNTPEVTLTGNIHGMHLASLMGFGPSALTGVHGSQVKIKKENLLHIGGSDFDQAELDFVAKEGIQCFSLFDLLSQNLGALLPLIDKLSSRVKNIWVSLDLDVIDKVYAPGAGMPNPAGLSYREIAAIAHYIGSHCNVVGVDVVEYNPLQDQDNKTAELGIELIARFLGKEYSWYTNYLAKNKVS